MKISNIFRRPFNGTQKFFVDIAESFFNFFFADFQVLYGAAVEFGVVETEGVVAFGADFIDNVFDDTFHIGAVVVFADVEVFLKFTVIGTVSVIKLFHILYLLLCNNSSLKSRISPTIISFFVFMLTLFTTIRAEMSVTTSS